MRDFDTIDGLHYGRQRIILDFDEGDILINGKSIKKDPIACKSIMAYIPDNPELYDGLSGIKYLNFIADIYKVSSERRIELIKKYVEEKDIIRPQDMVVKSVVNKSVNKVFIIQSIDRQMDFEDIAKARDMDFDELLTEIEAIVHSGTKLNIKYYIDETVDEDKAEEIYLYFKEDAETDSLEEAIKELGPDFTEEEIRLVRIQFMSEMGN